MNASDATYVPLKPGWRGTQQTVRKMQHLVAVATIDPRVRRCAEWIVRDARGGDRPAEARANFDFVRDSMRFTRDPSDVELLQDPRALLARIAEQGWAAGDCDDQSMLTAALGHTIRLPIVFVLLGPAPKVYEHVYAAMETPEGLVSLDTALPHPEYGKHANAKARLVVPALRGL